MASALASPRFWALRPEWLDLHQEVMGRIVESLRRERFDPSRDLRTYVQAVARYTALTALTERHRLHAMLPLDEAKAGASGGAEERAARRQLARRVLDAASEDCHRLLRAYFFEQRGYAEIAGSLGVPVGTVKSRLARCLQSAHRALRWRSTFGGPGGSRTARHQEARGEK